MGPSRSLYLQWVLDLFSKGITERLTRKRELPLSLSHIEMTI